MTDWQYRPEGLVDMHGTPLACVACGSVRDLYEAQRHGGEPIEVGDKTLVLCPTCFGGGHTTKVRGEILEAVSREIPHEFLTRGYPLAGRPAEWSARDAFDAERHYLVRAVRTLVEQRRPHLCWTCGRDTGGPVHCDEHRGPEPDAS